MAELRPDVAEAVDRFYAERAQRLAWLEQDGWFRARAWTLVRALELADRDGLDPADYRAAELGERVAHNQRAPLSDDEQWALDRALTRAFLAYAIDLSSGRVEPRTVDETWYLQPPRVDVVAALQRAIADNRVLPELIRLRPPHPAYDRLRAALARYQEIAHSGGFPVIPDGPVLRPDEPADPARVLALRRRLAREGYLETLVEVLNPAYDDTLADAVRQFQRNHLLVIDGALGADTLAALNVSAADRAAQIALNMERWRWLPRDLGETHVRVNVAAFELTVFDAGREVMSMPVVVGERRWTTPFFRDDIEHVVLNPPWHVPPEIAETEIWPEVERDPDFLQKHRFTVTAAGHLRREPGPGNPLGDIKFASPNQHAIYLHDTPEPALFEHPRRAYSHGCIRVARPLELAAFLLRDDPTWTRERLDAAFGDDRTRFVQLPAPVPLHLFYFTAEADAGGERVRFAPDTYGVDVALREALDRPLAGAVAQTPLN